MSEQILEIPKNAIIMLPSSTLEKLQQTQEAILEKLNSIQTKSTEGDYITAIEFMSKTSMCRATFDEKRQKNEIEVIKRGRKLYLKASAIAEYFS